MEKDEKKIFGKILKLKWFRWVLAVGVIAIAIVIFVLFKATSGKLDKSYVAGLFTVCRSDLTISITESGDIKALNSKDIKSEVEGRTTIISIVDEGTNITAEDVNDGKILVELDSSDIKQRLTQQEINFLNSESSYTEAKEALDIQKKQNDSDIKAGQMKVKFALMDIQKYLGDFVAEKNISAAANPESDANKITTLIDDPNLGGEALQKSRELDGDIYLKMQELELAKSKLEWTEKLFEKEYVSLNDKEADRLDKESKNIAWEKAKTAKELFIKYEFPKQTEKFLSDYNEAMRELERTRAGARSKLAQAQAKLKSNEATRSLQKERLEKLSKQFNACIIKARSPGQVVYWSSTDRWSRTKIEEGAEIRERQNIISIPDMSEMKVEIKIHETWIDKIKVGQKAKIKIAAFLDKNFTGSVLKKKPLADPEDWLNPDLRVYSTDVSIEGTHDFLKTGMTAKVEIVIEQLEDVIIVPVQAIVNRDGKKVCYVNNGGSGEEREVETGSFNDDSVEIKSGLIVGEKVLLSPPRIRRVESENKKI